MANGNQTGGLLPGETEEPLLSPSPSAMASPGLQPGETEEPISAAPTPADSDSQPYGFLSRLESSLVGPKTYLGSTARDVGDFFTAGGRSRRVGREAEAGNINAYFKATGVVPPGWHKDAESGGTTLAKDSEPLVNFGEMFPAKPQSLLAGAGKGIADAASSLTTPQSMIESPVYTAVEKPVAAALTAYGMSEAAVAALAPKLAARGFSAQMILSAAKQVPDLLRAIKSDDTGSAGQILGSMAAAGGFATLAWKGGNAHGPTETPTTESTEPAPSEDAGTQPRTTQGFALHPGEMEAPIETAPPQGTVQERLAAKFGGLPEMWDLEQPQEHPEIQLVDGDGRPIPPRVQGAALRGAWLGPEPQKTGEAVPETEQPKSDMSEVDRSELPGKLVDPRTVAIDYESHPFRLQDDVDDAKQRASEGKPLTALVHTDEETGTPEVIDGHGSTEAALEMGLPLQISETPNVEGDEAIGLRAASHYLAADKPEVTAEVGDDVQNAGGIQPAGAEKTVPELKAEDAAVRARLPESLVPAPSLREGLQEGENEEPISESLFGVGTKIDDGGKAGTIIGPNEKPTPGRSWKIRYDDGSTESADEENLKILPSTAGSLTSPPKDVTYWRTDTRTGRETKLDGPPAEGVKARANEIISMRDGEGREQVIQKGSATKSNEVVATQNIQGKNWEYRVAKSPDDLVQPGVSRQMYHAQIRPEGGGEKDWDSAYFGHFGNRDRAAESIVTRNKDLDNYPLNTEHPLLKSALEARQKSLDVKAAKDEADRVAGEEKYRKQQELKVALDEKYRITKFPKADIQLNFSEGRKFKTEGPSIGGLVVHKPVDFEGKPNGKGYIISHAGTGFNLGMEYSSQSEAKMAAMRVSELADFTKKDPLPKGEKGAQLFKAVKALRDDSYADLSDLGFKQADTQKGAGVSAKDTKAPDGGTTLHSNPFADPTLAIKAIKSVANFFTPDEDKASALESLRARTGEAAYQKEQIYQELKGRRDSWDSEQRASSDSPDAFHAFYDDIERGDKNRGEDGISPEMEQSIARGQSELTPKDREGMAVLRGLFDDTREAIRNLGTGKLAQFYEDYAPHRYAKDDGRDFSMSARRPLSGSKSALMQRTYSTMAEGLDSGKSPESYNPYDMAMNHLQDMNKYLLSEGLKKSGREDGLVRFAKSKNSAPDGWVAVDPWRVGPGGVAGNWYAPKGYADVINRYLSPGLKGNPTYDFARGFNNVLTQLQLGVSAYHVGASGINSMVSGVALGMEQLARGATRFDLADIARGAKNIFTSPLKPILNFRQGGAEITKYLGKNLADEYTEAIKQAGGRVTLDPTYRNNAIESALKSWREGAKGQAILKTPAALLEAMSKPIMTTAMRMKLGAFHDLAFDVFNQRDSQGWSDSKTTRELQSAWKSVDNRFGQVVYDNLNWNRTIKDLAQIGLRSTGWNWGTFSEIGGGLIDPVREAGKAIRGEDAKLLSHRTAYTMALPMVVGTLGGIYHYLHTGQAPQTAKDLFYPMNGQKTSTGEPDRSVFASYMKDVVGFSNHPFDTVINKLSPSISMMADMIENKDFYGDKIRNEDDPGMKQLADEVKYAVKEAIPFSVRNFQQSTKQSAEQAVENAVGVSPAPRAITRTDAENLAYKYNQDERPGSRTTEQTEKSRNISGWRQKYLSGQISTKDLRAAVSSKQLTLHDALQISNEKGKPSIVNLSNSLDLGRVLNIFDAANPAERKELRPLIAKKFGSLRLADHPPEERQQLIDRTRKALGVRGGRPASAPAPLAGSLPGSLDPYANLPSQLQ